uniref:Uncharacterized protein n=1 Tax=Anguilla anguilla TaxID=7936 RepID=A0A0E9QMT1_ANGAN
MVSLLSKKSFFLRFFGWFTL